MRKATRMRRIAALVTLLTVALAFAAAQPADEWWKGKTIRDIRFDGLSVVLKTDLEVIIKEYKGKPFSDELYDGLLASVYGLDYFSEIVPEALPGDASYSSVVILFRVTERPAVASVSVSGNSGIRSNEILEVVSIKPKTIFNRSRIRLDEIAVRQLYQKKGFIDVVVSSSLDERADGSVDISYIIQEGSKYTVEKIEFNGIGAFSASALKGELKLKEKALFQSGEFSEAKLAESLSALELYYKNRGYIDAAVLDVQRVTSEKSDTSRFLSLIITVSEGIRYTYGGMTFAGNTIYPSEKLASQLRQKQGAVLNYQRLMEDQGRVADVYYDNGYIFNGFELIPSRDEERASISYVLQVSEGPQALIERVVFRGNVKTKEFVLRREIPIADGDIFSKAKIMEGLRNLYNLQYFSALEPQYEMGAREPYVVLVVNVVEQSTADIQFGLSFVPASTKGNFPLVGLVKWNDRNFLGNGQTFSLGTNVSPESQDLTMSFGENWLTGKRWSGSLSFSFEHEKLSAPMDNDFNGVPDPYNSYEEYKAANKTVPDANKMEYHTWEFGVGLSSGYTFKLGFADLTTGGGYQFKLMSKTYDADTQRPYDTSIAQNLNTWLPSNTVYARALLNGLDLWYDPSMGYYASQKLSFSGFLATEQSRYVRSDSKLEGYLKLVDVSLFESFPLKIVLGGHSGFSALMPWFGRDAVETSTSSEYLRIDGTFVGRGWSGTKSLYGYDGIGLWENWLELRIPVVPGVLSFDSFLDAAALLQKDGGLLNVAGAVTKTSSSGASGWSGLSAENFAFSFGMGLRFAIPQFPFRLYFAKTFYAGDAGLAWANPGNWEFVLSITQPIN